jgi:oxygen-independent coproporphyrinogen-3 oxidase
MTHGPDARLPGVQHLYVHLPFCGHRCGYCDFVTSVGRRDEHKRYAKALLRELEREGGVLSESLETVFVGGGTPTYTEPAALRRVLAALPPAAEVTVESNPETVTPELAALLREHGVTRISLGAQSFQPRLLETLERRATPDDVRRAFAIFREAGFDNISLDLIYGIPGQTHADLADDLEQALALDPDHLSAYELEAKPGTRFTLAHGAELEQQAEAMEDYVERVVGVLVADGFRWYETANFCRPGERDLRAHHNLGYWLGHDYLGIGVGAVSTVRGQRRRNAPSVGRYLSALVAGKPAPHELEELDEETQLVERLMLGLRLDVPLALEEVGELIDSVELARLTERGLVEPSDDGIRLTDRGRLLGDAVTAALMTA